MLRIDDTIFSLDILEKKFACDLPKCFGNCCRYGDSGAPVSKDEAAALKEIWPVVKPYLRPEGIKSVEQQGTSITDPDNDLVTPLIENRECAYTIIKDNTYMCGIEQAYVDGKVSIRKPLSCHLFPAKLKYFSDFKAINYSELPVCEDARRKGQSKSVYVYEFLKEPLTRALGKKMYKELCTAAVELRKSKLRK